MNSTTYEPTERYLGAPPCTMTQHVELLSFRLVDESVIATFCGWNLGVNGVMLWSQSTGNQTFRTWNRGWSKLVSISEMNINLPAILGFSLGTRVTHSHILSSEIYRNRISRDFWPCRWASVDGTDQRGANFSQTPLRRLLLIRYWVNGGFQDPTMVYGRCNYS